MKDFYNFRVLVILFWIINFILGCLHIFYRVISILICLGYTLFGLSKVIESIKGVCIYHEPKKVRNLTIISILDFECLSKIPSCRR